MIKYLYVSFSLYLKLFSLYLNYSSLYLKSILRKPIFIINTKEADTLNH